MSQIYTEDEAKQSCLEYFGGDELASSVWINKYALKDNDGNLYEKSPDDMHDRIASEFARIESKKFKKPLTKELIRSLLDKFKYIVPQGSPMFGIGNPYQIVSLSNCYLLDIPLDSYTSILEVDEQLVNISKRRGGVGIDLSNLRPSGSPTKNAARSSTGVTSWMERYSNSIREVGQNARRGALMLTLSVHHPDILEFCTVKNDEKRVTGANISVRLSKEFLDAVKSDSEYELRWPVDSKEPIVSKNVSAKKVWETIIHSAWLRAEPGILDWSNVELNTPADYYEEYKSRGTNPCFRGDNKLITSEGMKQISDIIGRKIKVWNGKEWSEVEFKKTAENQEIYQIGVYQACICNKGTKLLHTETKIFVTGYHKFYLEDGSEVLAKDLKEKDRLLKFAYPEDYCRVDISVQPVVISIKKLEELSDVYCCEEQKEHKLVVEGVLVGNCSEINLSPLDSCRLLAMNLYSYVKNPFTQDARFDYELFTEHCEIAQRLMDDLVDLEAEKIQTIIDKVNSDPEPESVKSRELAMWKKILRFNNEGRRTGTGITALGDCLAALNITYGSNKSLEVVDIIFKNLKHSCYRSSVEMAKELGPFNCYDSEKEKDCPFIKRIRDEDPVLYEDMCKYGRRNICLTTVAPGGSISMLTQTSSGIEPVFSLGYTRRKKINPGDTSSKVDFIDTMGDKWEEFTVYHPKVKEWMKITGRSDVEKSPWFGCCAEDIDWNNRVILQSIMQSHICHSISSTVNLPENVTEQEVANIYETAFDNGVKGITVYRKNCRSGVLVDLNKKTEGAIVKNDAPKRPKTLKCRIHHVVVKSVKYYVVVGLLGNDPYEVFVGRNSNTDGDPIIPKSRVSGTIIKKKQGEYEIKDDNEESITVIQSSQCEEHEEAIARLTSIALRHGSSMQFIADSLSKVRGDMSGFSKSIARVLKTYIKDGTTTNEKCPSCESSSLIFQEGCRTCPSCGWSKCS